MDPSKVKIPKLMNLNAETITENTIAINSNNPDPRMKYVLERLVVHLHDFARETRLSTDEWMAGIEFLTKVGQICTDVRQEFILLSDVFGLSLLVDSMNHPKPPASTEGTVLGPFHTHEAELKSNGEVMAHDPAGKPLLVVCTIKDTKGNPIEDVKIDIWETDSSGHYDVQDPNYSHPDGRCVMKSDKDGVFWFKGIVPVSYPIPHDGPVGQFLKKVHRHPYRPAHMHFMFEKPGYDHLITALYHDTDPYITSDAVFGVKDTLIVTIPSLTSLSTTTTTSSSSSSALSAVLAKNAIPESDLGTYSLMTYDFVLVSDREAKELRVANSRAALERLGKKMGEEVRIDEDTGLPVVDVD